MSSNYATNAPKKNTRPVLIGVAIIAVIIAAWGVFTRLTAHAKLRDLTATEAVIAVAVMTPKPSDSVGELILPGDLQAFADAPIYARTSGYVKQRLADIGEQVKAGQLLAELDTPEADQQMRQAEADLATAQANATLATATAKRWADLRASDAVSPQEADEKAGDASAKTALLASAQANMQRFRDLQSFKRITAPFAGVITARNTDIGALVTTGSSGQELFRVADTQTLRIYVNVPQSSAREIKIGAEATLNLIDRPEQTFTAKVIRTSRALDSTSRSLRVELNLDNRTIKLLPGAYARVHFPISTSATQLRLPVNTLLFRKEGMQVATVDANNKVQLKSIVIAQDFGNEVVVGSGLAPQDRVIVNPPDSLIEGQTVRLSDSATNKSTDQPAEKSAAKEAAK